MWCTWTGAAMTTEFSGFGLKLVNMAPLVLDLQKGFVPPFIKATDRSTAFLYSFLERACASTRTLGESF